MRRLLPLLALLAAPAQAAPRDVLVRLQTSLGPIVVDLDVAHAPITATNFLHYVDTHRFDGITFYRAARSKYDPKVGFVQGGINHKATLAYFPIDHEPTSKTGLHHVDGTLSMARNEPGTASGDWIICVGNQTYLDARGSFVGYAAFGHVVSGMPIVRQMLTRPTFPGGFSKAMENQTMREPVRIISARRVSAR